MIVVAVDINNHAQQWIIMCCVVNGKFLQECKGGAGLFVLMYSTCTSGLFVLQNGCLSAAAHHYCLAERVCGFCRSVLLGVRFATPCCSVHHVRIWCAVVPCARSIAMTGLQAAETGRQHAGTILIQRGTILI